MKRKMSIYEAADKWVTAESVSISAKELKAYAAKRALKSKRLKK